LARYLRIMPVQHVIQPSPTTAMSNGRQGYSRGREPVVVVSPETPDDLDIISVLAQASLELRRKRIFGADAGPCRQAVAKRQDSHRFGARGRERNGQEG
jgi:hypothetical protein